MRTVGSAKVFVLLLTLGVLAARGGEVLAPPPSALPQTTGVLRIQNPRPGTIVSGSQDIELSMPQPPAGERVVVEVLVDGVAAGRLDGPPWRLVFNFGDSLRSRRIAARVVQGPGLGLTAEVTTRGFDPRRPDQTARVDLVNLWVTVRDRAGKYVGGLEQDAFRIFEGTVPQEISHFAFERRPLAAAIVLDTSLSMKGDPIHAAREAAIRFVRSLAPGDRVMVVAFSDESRVLVDLSEDRDAAAASIATVEAKGGTALYDAIWATSDCLAREEGRKVIVLLSDGHDEASSGLEPGSLHTFEEALEKALRSEAILFTIGFGKKLEAEFDFYKRTSLKEILERLASDSGGTSYFPSRTGQLRGAYEMIGEELRHQYNLAYLPKNLRPDGAWRPIRVSLTDPALRAYTRRGYYAPKG